MKPGVYLILEFYSILFYSSNRVSRKDHT